MLFVLYLACYRALLLKNASLLLSFIALRIVCTDRGSVNVHVHTFEMVTLRLYTCG